MSYEDYLIREMTDETPPNHDDACMVCDKIDCVCEGDDLPELTELGDADGISSPDHDSPRAMGWVGQDGLP